MPGRPANDRRAGAAGPGLLRLSPRCRSYGPNELRGPGPAKPARDPGVKRVLRGEREDRVRRDGLARLQLGGGEVGLVGRVREVLRLEGVRLALAVSVTADAHQRAG